MFQVLGMIRQLAWDVCTAAASTSYLELTLKGRGMGKTGKRMREPEM